MNWARFEAVVGFVGSILGIIAFIWQFWPLLRPKRQVFSQSDTSDQLLIASTPPRIGISIPESSQSKGVLYAVLSALIWSVSHNTFRTSPALTCSSEIMAALVFLGGGICVAIYCLILEYIGNKSNVVPAPSEVLSILCSRVGIAAVILNAIEFVFYLRALHLITAGQTMALWKTNPLWTLLILALIYRRGVQHASIAAAFCVVAGVYFVLSPQISGSGATWDISGSLFAVFGGAAFAGYSCSLHFILQNRSPTTKLFRHWLQAALLVTTGSLLCIYSSIVGQDSNISVSVAAIVVFNSVRIAVTYILYSEAIALTKSPVLVASIVCLEVPTTMLIEYFWFGSTTANNVLGGSIMIIIGILSILKENDDLWQGIRHSFSRVSAEVD